MEMENNFLPTEQANIQDEDLDMEQSSDELDTEENESEKDGESKSDKFIRLGENRVNKVMKAVERLGALSNRGSYEYTQEQVEAMFGAIEEAVADAKKGFADKKSAFSFGK